MFGETPGVRDGQLELQCPRNLAGDLVLKAEQIAHVAVEPLRPEVRARFSIDELRVYANLLARSTHAPFQEVTHAELAADALCIDRLSLIGEGGATGDYEAPLDAREVGRQVLGNAVGEIFLLRVVAEIGERQHYD